MLEQEVTVLMTNFATILNDLNSHYADRNEYIQSLCRNRLLIIDDLGMERGTDYGLEQVYNVIDARYRSNKPLIITTNLTLNEMQNETNIARKRIYGGTDYGLEQVYNVIDARYRSNKPLIITTNLTLNEMQNETNIARKRIYDRVLEMCIPVQIQGDARYRSNKPLIITTNLTLNEMQNETNIARKRIYDRVLEMCIPVQIQGPHMRKIERDNKLKKYIEGKK